MAAHLHNGYSSAFVIIGVTTTTLIFVLIFHHCHHYNHHHHPHISPLSLTFIVIIITTTIITVTISTNVTMFLQQACVKLWCEVPEGSGKCKTAQEPAADGTICGPSKVRWQH